MSKEYIVKYHLESVLHLHEPLAVRNFVVSRIADQQLILAANRQAVVFEARCLREPVVEAVQQVEVTVPAVNKYNKGISKWKLLSPL